MSKNIEENYLIIDDNFIKLSSIIRISKIYKINNSIIKILIKLNNDDEIELRYTKENFNIDTISSLVSILKDELTLLQQAIKNNYHNDQRNYFDINYLKYKLDEKLN